MNARRIVTIGVALLIGLGGPALLLQRVGRPARPAAGTASGDLPWPYCAPDAPAPSLAAIPERYPEDLLLQAGVAVDPGWFGPIKPLLAGDALVPITRLEILSKVDPSQDDPTVSALGPELARILHPPYLLALAETGPAVFQADTSVKRLGAFTGGPRRIHGGVRLTEAVADRLADGDRVLAAVAGMSDDGTLGIEFALDLTTGEILWGDGFIEEDRTAFAEFVRTRFPHASSGPALAELVVAWNREQGLPNDQRPISDAWGRFIAETFSPPEHPQPGSETWWEQAPPLCRSLADAPDSVLAELKPVRVVVRVPSEMPQPEDAVICLRIPLATMPSCTVFRPDPSSEYIELEAYTDGVNPISVQIAHETPRGISWVERVEIASIPPEMATDPVLVSLDPALAGATYEEIVSNVEGSATAVAPLGDTEPIRPEG